jgi:hypothetical protein
MRVIGHNRIALPSLTPSAAGLQQAEVHQTTAMALMCVASTGVRKGIYRYATHEAANRASDEALSRAIVSNLSRMQASA